MRPDLARDARAGARASCVARERLGTTTGDLARLAHRVKALAWLLAALTLACAAAALGSRPTGARPCRGSGSAWRRPAWPSWSSSSPCGEIVLAGVADPGRPRRRGASGARSSATCGRLAGCSPSRAASSRPRRVADPPDRARGPLRGRLAAGDARAEHDGRQARPARGRADRAGVLVIASPLTVLQAAAIVAGVLRRSTRGSRRCCGPIYRARRRRTCRRARRGRLAIVAALAAILVAGSAGAFVGDAAARRARPPTAGRLQRQRRAVRPPARPGRPAGHPQLDVGAAAGLVLVRAGRADRPASSPTASAACCSTRTTPTGSPTAASAPYFGSDDRAAPQLSQDGVSEASVQAALRLRERAGFRGEGERGIYLCHTFCELGATPLADGLTRSTTSSSRIPDEVVVVDQPGLRHARGLRRRDRRRRPAAYTFDAGGRRDMRRCGTMIDAGTRLARARREPRRRGALVPASPTSSRCRRRRSRSPRPRS